MKKNEELKAKLLLEGWQFEPIDDDDVYTLDEWIGMVESGGFIDYDGMGDYALNGEKASLKSSVANRFDPWVYPSDVKKGKIDRRFTHIIWYNR